MVKFMVKSQIFDSIFHTTFNFLIQFSRAHKIGSKSLPKVNIIANEMSILFSCVSIKIEIVAVLANIDTIATVIYP